MIAVIGLESVAALTAHGQADLQSLGASEQARLASFSNEARRRSFLAGRVLARSLAEQVAGTGVVLEIDEQGRSSLPGHPGLYLSISHSGDWAACALADAPVGIDIENTHRPRGDLPALAAMVHDPAQCEEIAALPDEAARLRRFYQLWTLKEAALKREGQGLDFARMRAMDFASAEPADAFEPGASGRGFDDRPGRRTVRTNRNADLAGRRPLA